MQVNSQVWMRVGADLGVCLTLREIPIAIWTNTQPPRGRTHLSLDKKYFEPGCLNVTASILIEFFYKECGSKVES
jgi:hypothetical protein